MSEAPSKAQTSHPPHDRVPGYLSYFNEVKARIGAQWDPNTPLRKFDPTGDRYGGRRYRTILTIVLTADGRLARTEVQQSSGVPFLDDAGISAVQHAAPFAPPPPRLVGKEGTITFPFKFDLDTHGRVGQSCPGCEARSDAGVLRELPDGGMSRASEGL